MSLTRKKITIIGAPGVGKTSLVRQFVHTIFSENYHSTVGVQIDRKDVVVNSTFVTLMLWDIEGKSPDGSDISTGYLRGSSGLIFVADGTQPDGIQSALRLLKLTQEAVGELPAILALNKSDLTESWCSDRHSLKALRKAAIPHITTSVKTGAGVEETFLQLTQAILGPQ